MPHLRWSDGHADEAEYSDCQSCKFDSDGFMLDCSRNGVAKVEVAKRLILQMALMGLNTLMLYTEDTYEIPEQPYFGYMRGRYSQKELQELDQYAQGFGIELIPCIQTLAHLNQMFRWSAFQSVKDVNDIMLAEEPATYELIEQMLRACRNSFSTHKIHIGMDEAWMLGLGNYQIKRGVVPTIEIFCRHLSKVNEICKNMILDL